jgi:transketolase
VHIELSRVEDGNNIKAISNAIEIAKQNAAEPSCK